MLNCIAVDDEKLVLDLLEDNIRKIPFLSLAARCKNAMEAAEVLHTEKVDLIFLDIQMPGISGLQFLKTLSNPPMIILVTAYSEYAIEGFNLNVVDYLLKPFSFERFLKACNKAHEFHNLRTSNSKDTELPDYLFVWVTYNLTKISIPDILYIEGMKDYVKIFLKNEKRPVITKLNLKAIEEKLKGYHFVRIHRSYVVSVDKITSVKRDLICIGDIELPLSDNYKAEVIKLLQR
ncbi:MAG TPA: LytTR family DNA-binding domain-containing protein [Flavipsychrobacter sp.]|nr:LytTR family DNA-binding domain-containing protein [Flavipsychrobacter sp.]